MDEDERARQIRLLPNLRQTPVVESGAVSMDSTTGNIEAPRRDFDGALRVNPHKTRAERVP
jgi:hypothetical protein